MTRRNQVLTAASALAVAAVLAGSAIAGSAQPTVTIRHQTRGCHAWSFNGGAFKASLRITLARGTTLTVVDDDVMPHTLVQLAGPKAKLVAPAMRHAAAQARVVFARRGTYRFTTRAGEDYAKGIETVGPDNVLRLTVVVA